MVVFIALIIQNPTPTLYSSMKFSNLIAMCNQYKMCFIVCDYFRLMLFHEYYIANSIEFIIHVVQCSHFGRWNFNCFTKWWNLALSCDCSFIDNPLMGAVLFFFQAQNCNFQLFYSKVSLNFVSAYNIIYRIFYINVILSWYIVYCILFNHICKKIDMGTFISSLHPFLTPLITCVSFVCSYYISQ